MIPTCLSSTAKHWISQGIADRVWGDLVFTPELRTWMQDNLGERLGGNLWYWDHYREEDEVAIFFMKPQHATLFKLTWL